MATPASNVLTFTGERFAPEVTGAIWYEHWHRYCVAQPLAKGLSVLDAACGEGYGSFLLAQTAKEVVGIDIAPEAVAHAQSRYAAPNLRYVEGSCTAIPLAEASIDLIVSFETIEHLQQQKEMLNEFRRVLAPDGILVISSPNPAVYTEKLQSRNEYHVRELTREELSGLLTPLFPQQKWYGQRVLAHSVLWTEEPPRQGRLESSLIDLIDDKVELQKEPAPPMYFIVVCAAKSVRLPPLPALSLFDDGKQSLYNDYMRALLREKELYWQELDARKIAEDRLGELITVTNDLASARQQVAALNNRLVPLEDAYESAKAELDSERQYTAALTWEERNGRAIAEARLNELITAVNNLSSERDRAEALNTRVNALEETRQSLESQLNEERQKRSTAEWDLRNAQSIAEERLNQLVAAVNSEPQKITMLEWDLRNAETIGEERLKELINVTNELAREREKTAMLTDEVTALKQASDTARNELAQEREQLVALQWEERNARSIAEERLKEAIATANDLSREREKVLRLTDELNTLENESEKAEAELARERQKIAGLEWEERDARKVAEQRLSELIEAVNALASERDKSSALALRISNLEGALGMAQSETASVRAHFETVRAAYDEKLEAANAALKDYDARLKDYDVRWLAMHRHFETEMGGRDESLRAYQGEVARLNKEVASLTADLVDVRSELENRSADLVDVRSQLENRSADLVRVLADLEFSVTDRKRMASELETASQSLARVLVDLEWAVAERRRTETELEQRTEDLEQTVLERERWVEEHGRAVVAINETASEVDRTTAILGHTKADLEHTKAELARTRSELEQTMLERGRWEEEYRRAVAALNQTAIDLGNKTGALEHTTATLEEAALERGRWQEEYGRAVGALNQTAIELGNRTAELEHRTCELAVARAELDGTRADFLEVEGEMQQQECVLAEVRRRLSFRETMAGWLRWPLSRIKAALRASG